MTKIFRLSFICMLAVAGVWMGCSTENMMPAANGSEITFRATGDRPQLRAAVTTTEGIKDFVVSGLYGKYEDQTLLDATVVTRTETGGWDYFPKQTWNDADISFYAYSPAGTRNVTSGFKGNSEHTITYRVPDDPNLQEDFLVAVTEPQSSGVVSLHFKHALSRLMFRAKSAIPGTYVEIKEIALYGLDDTGTWKLKADAPTTAGTPSAEISTGVPTGTDGFKYYENADETTTPTTDPAYLVNRNYFDYFWGGLTKNSSESVKNIEISEAAVVSEQEFTAITSNLQGFMVMPQQTTSDFEVRVTYQIGNGTPKVRAFPVKDLLTQEPGSSICFEPGRQYFFDILVGKGGTDGDVIIFVNPDVTDWNEVNPPVNLPEIFSVSVAPKNGSNTTSINFDETLELAATILPLTAKNQAVTWEVVSGKTAASVDADGVVSGKNTGECSNTIVVIRATSVADNTVFGEYQLAVIQEPAAGVAKGISGALYSTYTYPGLVGTWTENIREKGYGAQTYNDGEYSGRGYYYHLKNAGAACKNVPGYHLPTMDEWNALQAYINGSPDNCEFDFFTNEQNFGGFYLEQSSSWLGWGTYSIYLSAGAEQVYFVDGSEIVRDPGWKDGTTLINVRCIKN